MKPYIFIIFTLVVLTSCRKKYTYTCTEPQLVLQQQGYSPAEWDTIIIRYFEKGYTQLTDADTFVADSTNEVLLLDPGNDTKDLEIHLPSVNRSYRLYDITVTPVTYEDDQYSAVECYSDISYMLDGQFFSHINTPVVYADLLK